MVMSFQKVDNWLKNQNEDGVAEDYVFMLKSELSEIQNSAEFSEELRKHNALGNKIRYSIYKYMEQKELCTCVLSKLFDIKEATISHHLKILVKAGLIVGLKRGLYTVYYTKEKMIEALNQ
jgi:DNA-binding transcriptional ArsR family regulator